MSILRIPMLVLAVILGVSGQARAQDPPRNDEHARHEAMEARHEAMEARHEAMMADMEAANARLDALVTAMEAAEGAARIDAMAELLTELVAQRKEMCEHMMGMEHGKMGPGGMSDHDEGRN